MTWEADMLWEERLQRQAEMLSNTAQGFPVPQDSKSPPAPALAAPIEAAPAVHSLLTSDASYQADHLARLDQSP
jgi:hypothetical protein